MRKDAIQTKDLGKRYGSFWALEHCNITVPEGSVSALAGPNGAGKSTLLKLLTGLSIPSSGESDVLGQVPQQREAFLADVGYLAQEIPLYKALNANDHIIMGRHLNKRWDETFIRNRLQELHIPLSRPVSQLSGGQRAQVALALALAKKPKLLLLDEPVAALDPLARHDFLAFLTQTVTEGGLTVMMSSHLLADLERISDHVVVLAAGKTQLCDSIKTVLDTHALLVGQKRNTRRPGEGFTIINETHTPHQSTLLVRIEGRPELPEHWQRHKPNIEEIILAYMSQNNDLQEGGTR